MNVETQNVKMGRMLRIQYVGETSEKNTICQWSHPSS
jgi:hypothetical protein